MEHYYSMGGLDLLPCPTCGELPELSSSFYCAAIFTHQTFTVSHGGLIGYSGNRSYAEPIIKWNHDVSNYDKLKESWDARCPNGAGLV